MKRIAPALICSALFLDGCTVFEEIGTGVDAQLVGPVMLQPRAFSEIDPDTGDTVFRTQIERIVIVEGRNGSTAQYEGGLLPPLGFGIAGTSQTEVGAALGSPDDRLVLGSALEFLSDTVEYHVAVWRIEEPAPIWQATDNTVFGDLEAACDLEAIFAPQIQERIENEEGPVTPPLEIAFVDQRGGEVGEYPMFYTGWLSEDSLAVQIETAFRIEITDAAGRLLDIAAELALISMVYRVGPSSMVESCSPYPLTPLTTPAPVLDVAPLTDPAITRYLVAGQELKQYLLPDDPIEFPTASIFTAPYGPRPFER